MAYMIGSDACFVQFLWLGKNGALRINSYHLHTIYPGDSYTYTI